MKNTNLWVNSCYTFRQSTIKISDYIKWAKKQNFSWLAISDLNSTHAVFKFHRLCLEAKIKPIVGIEVQTPTHAFLFFPHDFVTFQDMLLLSSLLNDVHYEKKNVIQHWITKIKSHNASIILLTNKESNNSLKKAFPYVYLNNKELNLTRLSYLNQQGQTILKILKLIKNGQKQEFDTILQSLSVETPITENAKIIEEIVNRTNLSLDSKNKENQDENSKIHNALKKYCDDGLNLRFMQKGGVSDKYLKRLEYELSVVKTMGFSNYILQVFEIVTFARQNGILFGPGRGSAAGSLICYALHITQADPIKYNLIFERFLNVARKSLPDIDVDFEESKRSKIIDFINDKYCDQKSAQIITFNRYRIKNSINEILRALNHNLTKEYLTKVLKNCFSTRNLKTAMNAEEAKAPSLNDFLQTTLVKQLQDKQKANHLFWQFVFDLLPHFYNLPKNTGTHASGVIIAKKPLNFQLATIVNEQRQILTQVDMSDCESNGFFKYDILSLINLNLVSQVIKKIRSATNKVIKIAEIDINDYATLQNISNGNTLGVFQLESFGLRSLARRTNVQKFEDVAALISLYRPGPMINIDKFIANQRHYEKSIFGSSFDRITKETYGVLLYQEQVIELFCHYGNFSLSDGDLLRSAISKKKTNVINIYRDRFLKNCQKQNYNLAKGRQLFNYILNFTYYGFNKAHATSYAILAMWTAYLKTHYSHIFAIVYLNLNLNNENKIASYLKELSQQNVFIFRPSIDKSDDKFITNEKRIIATTSKDDKIIKANTSIICPLILIKGLGNVAAAKISRLRQENKLKTFREAIFHLCKVLSVSQMKALVLAGAFDCFKINRQTLVLHLNEFFLWSKIDVIDNDMPNVSGSFIISEQDKKRQKKVLVI